MSQRKRMSPAIVSLVVIVLLLVGAGGVYLLREKSSTSSDTDTTDTPSSSQTSEAPTETGASGETTVTRYTDGTYSADGAYSTPGGSEDISVTVTLKDDTITAVEATGSATGGNSAQYQRQFLAGYKDQVVGKSIDEVSLSRVAGSSLTSTGFNRALDTIKNDAQR